MLLKNLRDEIAATLARDPAARSRLEVVLCYPGFHALLYYRLAHTLWVHGWYPSGRADRAPAVHRPRHGRGDRRDRRGRRRLHALPRGDPGRHPSLEGGRR